MSTEKRITAKLRLGLILNREFHEKNRWVSALTPRLVESLLQRFDCFWIQDQKGYENNLGSVDALLSMEPGWAAPRLDFVRTPALREKLARTPSYIMYSDPHDNQWREDYFLQNGLDFILAYFYSPTLYHFRRAPADRILYFPWSIPDDWVSTEPITCRKQSRIALFGASQHEAYDVRNWCRTFLFVESLTNSGVENKVMADEEYMKWLGTWDAAIAAGSDDPRYRLTTPKYFEIPAAGSLLFAQETDDLESLGFRHMENCVLFNRSNFVELARQYLTNPADYAAIRKAGRELIRRRHRMSARIDFLEHHIRQGLEGNIHRRKTALGGKKKVTAAASRSSAASSVSTSPKTQQAAVFLSPEEVYLASADRMDCVVSNLRELKSQHIKQVDTYASVIGGLSGLNYLLAFDPRAIVFFDINPAMVAYARLIKAMIGISGTPEELISRIFCRSVDTYLARTGEEKLTCENQSGFLSMPVDETLLSDTLNRLSPEERSTFEAFVAPHLPATTIDGARNCRRLLPCWPIDERVPVGAGEALGTDEKGALVPNTNTFFFGHGWLASKEDYRKVRQALQNRPVRFISFDLLQSDWHLLSSLGERFVLHISNVDDWFPEAWKERAQALDRRVVEAQGLCWVVTSHNGTRRPAADPHTYAYAALAPYVCGEVVEVTHKVPWGFHEIDRVNVSADDYLRQDCRSDTTILHILLGEGISRDCFEQVLRKALDCSERVIILEHNAASSDWTAEQSKRFIREEHLHETVKQCLHGSSFKLSRTLVLAGERDLRRNLLVILDRDTAEAGKGNRPAAQTVREAVSPAVGSPVRKTRPRILLIADVPNWIFARHVQMLQRYLSNEFDFTIRFMGERFNEEDFDLIYPLEWVVIEPDRIRDPRKYITGIRSHLWWPDRDFNEFTRFLSSKFNRVHVVSRRLFDIFDPALPGVAYVTHGVDTEFFKPSASTDQSGTRVRLGWAGNRKSDAGKGFAEIIEPLGRLRGVELVFCGYSDRNLSLDEMRSFYDSLDIYVCASDLEGNNNSLLEAASMARAIITTDNGTVPEYLRHGENALIVGRNPEVFIQAVETLRNDPALRVRLGNRARQAITASWEWKDKAEDYRRFFRAALIAARPDMDSRAAGVSIQGEEQGHRPPDYFGSAERAYEIIQKLIGAEMHSQAINALENLTEEFPHFSPAHHLLAILYPLMGKMDQALHSHERAVDRDPDNVVYLKDYAEFLMAETGEIEKALVLLHRALAAQPGDMETMLLIGNLCAVQGRYGDATFFYEAVRKLAPGNRIAMDNLNALSAMACGASPGTAAGPAGENGRPRNPLTASRGQSIIAGGPAANRRNIAPLKKADDPVPTGAADLDILPSQIHFLMIDQCNAKCIMCGGNYYHSKSGRRITLDKFKRMAANLKLENATGIVLAGAGDPLLNKDLASIMLFARTAYSHLQMAITTNGIALSPKISRAIIEHRCDSMNISLNAATRQTYRRIMQVDGYDTVCQNVRNFIKLRNQAGGGTRVQLSCVISRLNIEELPALVELAAALGVDSINVMYCRFYPEDIRHLNIEDAADRLADADSLFYHQDLSDRMVTSAASLARKHKIAFSHEPLFKENSGPRPCEWPVREMLVGFDGEVYPCGGGEVHFKDKVEQGIYSFGNALTDPVESFWNGEHYRAIRLASKKTGSCPVPECRCCANTLSTHDVRAHIMDWSEARKDDGSGLHSVRACTAAPLVSVIVPTYNRPHMLINALKSIFGQTYQNYEVIVINDGGSDVRDLFEGLPGDSIRYLQHGANRGLPAARNTGIKAARGKYIAYLDDDDLFYPDHLETLVNFLESSEYQVAYTDAHRAFQEMQGGKHITVKKDVPYSFDFDYERILKGNFIPVLCIMHRITCFVSVGLFDETLQSLEDWDLWMRMSRKFQFAHIPLVTCSFSWRQDGSTMTSGQQQKMKDAEVIVSERGKEYHRAGMIHPNTAERSVNASFDYQAIRTLRHGRRREQAFAELQKYLTAFPDHAEAHADLGSLYYERGEKDNALRHYEKAVALNPINITALRSLADFYYVESKDIGAASCLYEKILSLNPEDADTLCILGNLSIERQAFDKARRYYLKALQVDSASETASRLLAALDSKSLGSPENEDPEDALLEANRLLRKGDTGRAITKLEEVLLCYPEEARAHNAIGNLYCLLKEIDKAFFHLDRAVQLQPGVLRFVKDLADAHLAEMGNVEAALTLYNRALALKPDDVDTLLRIGNICAAQQQFDDARVFYDRVLSIESGNKQAAENLTVLQRMVEEKPSSVEPAPVCQGAERPIGEDGRAEGCTLHSEATHRCASIIIPVFNQVEFTARCLETLYANTLLDRVHEIIVVDNASSDGTGTFLVEARKRYPKLKVLTNRENLLFAKACNQGADAAGGDYLVFLNNDTEPLEGWLGRALERLESDDSIGVVGIKLLYPDQTVQHCGIQFQKNAHPSHVVWPLHRYLRASADDPRVNIPEDVHAVTGACFFIRRDFFRRIGGFEERYGMYFEDTDLCFKARRGGKRVFYEPASVVIHHEGKSSASRAVINDLNVKAARLFFKIWKTELYSIELETLVDRKEGKYAYLPDHFWPDEVSPEEIVRMHNLLSSFPSCHVHFGGSGDALLLLSAFYDSDPEQTIVSVSNSTGMMKSFFDAFPKLKKVYFIPFPKNYTWHYIARRFFKSSDICRGLGATPTTTADYKEWNADLDIFKTYGIRQRPAWAVNFGKNRLAPRQVTLQPRGSLKGMVGSKRNALSTQDWARLLTHLEKKGVRPVIIGTPDEAAEYPCFGNAIDMRSYSFAEQMKLIAASDFFIGADSWGKTFSALAGIPTFVFHALRGDDLKDWKDASDHVFLDPWDEITVVKDFKEFRKSFDEAWRERFLSAADLKIRWEGSQFVHHSLALVNRELCLRLIDAGCEVSIVPYERDQFTPKDETRFKPIAERTKKPLSGPADVHVRHQWPPNFTPPPEGHWVIIQPWEFGSIPREWVHNMSAHVDEVWGPSHYVRDCYIRSGVPSERVFVVPNGVDIGLFNPDNAPYPLKTKKTFKFLFVGGTIQRKGIDILLDVYTKTFSSGDDVCLVIKDMGGQTFYKGQTAKDWIGRFQADPGSPEIEYIEHTLSDREIAGLYTACDCLAHPYRGEGFGLPIAEAMASGLPVIVTGHGAALDFCDDKTSYLIPAKEVKLPEKRIGEFDTVDFPWLAEPDKEGLARLMRHAETHREEAAAKGALAAEFIRANFTWDHAAEAVRKRVRELRGKPIVRQKRQDDSTSRKEGIQQELLSIIIPVSGEASNLRSCVDSIRKWTPEPHEMVFVESQAASGVRKWLKKISQRDPLCRVVPADGQPPVPDLLRLGLRSCTGKYVAVVEPDIVVTERWSAGMLEALESSADIGIVGPMMVNTEGRQNVPGTEGLSACNLESHAAAFQKRNRHRRAFSDRLSRSCMMFKRTVADDIGLTHEGPQREECVPDEWCLRSIYSGFQNLIAGDVLVYRSGNGDGQRISCSAAEERRLSAFAAKGGCFNADTPEDKRFLAMLTFREAEERFQQGDLRGATEACLEAIKLAPWKRGFYLALAEMLMQAKHFQEALDLLRESDPGEQEERTVSLLGCIHEGLGEDDEAGRKADRALAMSSHSVQALNLKGVLAFKRGEIEQARSFFKKATDAGPSWGEPFTNLGVLTWAEDQQAEALELLERGFVLTSCQSDLAERYHAAAVSLGALARAEKVFREARGLYPSNRTIAFLLINLLMSQENYGSAMEEIEAAMAAFEVDDGFISAALEVRGKVGPRKIETKTGHPTLSLCMIVKNEQPNLVRCLSNIKAAVDEIIIVDTGSTDRTKDLAAVFGAKVFDAPWTDDFAEARNTALSKATGFWILVLDADEAVSTADCLKLRDLLKHAASRKNPAGWLVTTRNYSPDMNLEGWSANDGSYGSEEASSGWFPSVKVRLFRNDPRIRYEGAVHEMVEPSMRRQGLAWRSCDAVVHHYGTVTGGGGPSKGESYYQLGKKKIEQTGGDPRPVYELAVQASRLKKYGEAVALWHRYLSSGCRDDRHLAFLNLGHALIETGRFAEAREASMAALSIYPGLKEAALNTALCEFYTGRHREAISLLEGLVAATPDYPPAFVLLSAARLLSGEKGSTEEMVQTLRKRNINGAPFYQVYGQKLHEAGRFEDAETILEAARKCWSAMLASLGIPTTAENIGALMAAIPLDGTGKKETPSENSDQSTRSGSGRPRLSLCMIVKNEERSIARALESVKTLADEMIVVDTGSSDGTKEIAAALGAKVFDFLWTDDFSSARNFSLSRATGDWILVIDADETVSSRDHETIRDLIGKSPAGTGGYDLTTRNYVVEATTAGWVANDGSYRDEEAGTGWYPNGKVRLFRNDPRIRFSGAVHELVEHSMLEAGITIAACDVPVHHTGKLDRASVLEKGGRYYQLGLKKIEESGGTPRAIAELAIQAGELGRYDDAIRLWRRYLDGKPVQDVKLATVNLINACLNADRFDEALLEARRAAGQANGTRELLLNCAAAEFFTGDRRKAIRMAEKILKKEPDYPPALTLLAGAHALAGHAGKSTECLQRLHEKGLQLRSQILPVIEKLRKAGKKDEADRLLSLLDWQPQAACGPTPPSPGRSRPDSGCSVQR